MYDAGECALIFLLHLKSYLMYNLFFNKVFGIVNSHTSFKHQHLVMDGCSDLIMEIFGKPIGYHARSAIGVNTLPLNAAVEVEAIVKIKPE